MRRVGAECASADDASAVPAYSRPLSLGLLERQGDMRLYLLRHGETEWSASGRKQGRGDSPLTRRGQDQVEACAERLIDELASGGQARLVSSPLGRARYSAEVLRARLADKIGSFEISDLLAEHDYGAWEGLTEPEIEQRFPGELDRRRADHWSYRVPRGESYELVADRVGRWFSEQKSDGVVVAVTHDIVSRVLRGLYLGLSHESVYELTHPHARIYLLASGTVRQCDAQLRAVSGSCLCGAIEFELVGSFEVSHCYCSRCRKKTGASRATGMLVKPSQVRFSKGEEQIRRWYLPSARSFGTSVCSVCGSLVPHLTRSGATMIVPAGAIDDDLPVKPSAHYQWSSRANWVELDESGLPCFEEHAPRPSSETIDAGSRNDTGEDVPRHRRPIVKKIIRAQDESA